MRHRAADDANAHRSSVPSLSEAKALRLPQARPRKPDRQYQAVSNDDQEDTLPASRPPHDRGFFFAFVRLCAVSLALSFAFVPAHTEDAKSPVWKEIKIASEGARPPYNYLDNNELAGFEIDLGRAICGRLAIKCTFVAQNWDDLIPGLLNHQYDAIMAAMEITDERREKIDFSMPYVRMPSAFIIANASELKEATPAALAGKTIGVEGGGTHQVYLEDVYKDSEIHTYGALEDAILDLADGRIDAVIGDKDAIVDFLSTRKEGQCCHIIADVPRDVTYFGDGIGIGVRHEDTTLKTMFDKALAALMADGTFDKISSKYFTFKIN
jgi:polar amino acid transport system substrate-binding protein